MLEVSNEFPWDEKQVARKLGMSPRTLRRRLQALKKKFPDTQFYLPTGQRTKMFDSQDWENLKNGLRWLYGSSDCETKTGRSGRRTGTSGELYKGNLSSRLQGIKTETKRKLNSSRSKGRFENVVPFPGGRKDRHTS